jgi:hypothetical protein
LAVVRLHWGHALPLITAPEVGEEPVTGEIDQFDENEMNGVKTAS